MADVRCRQIRRLGVAALAALLFASALEAHQLSLFVAAEGDQIQGSVRYTGSDPAAGVSIQVLDPQGRLLAELTSDGAGRFSYTARERVDHRLVAATGEGHGAESILFAEELPAALPGPPGGGPATPSGGVSATSGELEAIIERAVARQVRPLREELRAAEERARVSDLLGGIGYIVGIAGLALWWHARRWGRRG